MSNNTYRPSFLISTEVPEELHTKISEYADQNGIPVEEAYRKALKFFVAQCVHTQSTQDTTPTA